MQSYIADIEFDSFMFLQPNILNKRTETGPIVCIGSIWISKC